MPIGAAITGPEGRLLARGRNRIYEKSGPPQLLYGHRLAHAEMNALVGLEAQHDQPAPCVLYTTTEPCPLCTGAIRQYGVQEVHYASRDPAGGSIELLSATPFMRRREVRVFGPERPDLEIVIMAMYVEFMLRVRKMDPEWWLLEAWENVVPEGVHLGTKLAETGDLQRLQESNATAPKVVDHLAGLLQPEPG